MDQNLIDKEDWRAHYVKRGDPSKPTYYIIRRKSPLTGLFARWKIVGEHIRYALSNGWLPVVDMQNYPNPYLTPEKFGKENAWEYYFEQPLRIGLEQAYNGENIIVSAEGALPKLYESMPILENRDNVLTEWRMLVKLGLLQIKPVLMEEILAIREKLFSPTDRVLGVHLRGTDYAATRPYDHPISPPVEFAASIVVEKVKEWQCDKIFLATEDKSILKVFKNVFGDMCITLGRDYADYIPGKAASELRLDREDDHFLQGKDYLTEMVLLSTCNSFIAARCSGTLAVMLIADSFEHTYFFNLGRYGRISLD